MFFTNNAGQGGYTEVASNTMTISSVSLTRVLALYSHVILHQQNYNESLKPNNYATNGKQS